MCLRGATPCAADGACHGTLPVLESVRRKYGSKRVGVLVVHEGYADYEAVPQNDPKYLGEGGQDRRRRECLRRYAADYDFHFTQLMILNAESMKPYWSDSYPSVYFVDGGGKILARTHAHNAAAFRDQLAAAGVAVD